MIIEGFDCLPDYYYRNNIVAIPCNPAYWSGTRIATMAPAYSVFRPLAMSIHYVPTVSTNTNGTITSGTLWNNVLPTKNLEQALLTSNGGSKNTIYMRTRSFIKLGTNLSQNLYHLSGKINNETCPFIYLSTSSNQSIGFPGYFVVRYRFELKNPIGTGNVYKTDVGTISSMMPNDVWENTSCILLNNTNEFGAGTVFTIQVINNSPTLFFKGTIIRDEELRYNQFLILKNKPSIVEDLNDPDTTYQAVSSAVLAERQTNPDYFVNYTMTWNPYLKIQNVTERIIDQTAVDNYVGLLFCIYFNGRDYDSQRLTIIPLDHTYTNLNKYRMWFDSNDPEPAPNNEPPEDYACYVPYKCLYYHDMEDNIVEVDALMPWSENRKPVVTMVFNLVDIRSGMLSNNKSVSISSDSDKILRIPLPDMIDPDTMFDIMGENQVKFSITKRGTPDYVFDKSNKQIKSRKSKNIPSDKSTPKIDVKIASPSEDSDSM